MAAWCARTLMARTSGARTSPQTFGSSARTFDLARAVLLFALVLTALAYVNTLRFNFVYDDLPQIVNNPMVQSWNNVPRFFTEHVWAQIGQTGEYYRPLFLLWLLISYSLFGLQPFAWHLVSVALHLVAAWLVYRLGWRLTQGRLAGAIAAVVFGLHPAHIESVAWVSGLTDPLMANFVLGAILAYLEACARKTRAWLALAIVLYALGCLTKETAVLLPLVLLGCEWFFSRKDDTRWMRTAAVRLLPFLFVGMAYLGARYLALQGLQHPQPYTAGSLLASTPGVLWFYVRHLCWPFGLSVFYNSPLVTHPSLANFGGPLLAVMAVAAVAWWGARRSRLIAFALVFLVVFMLPPLIGIRVLFPEDMVHDRYLYLPVASLAILLAVGIIRLKRFGTAELFGQSAVLVAAIIACTVLLGTATAKQNVYWATDLTLYAHGVNVAPRNVLALDHLANEMYKRGQVPLAFDLYSKALAVDPNHWGTQFAVGLTRLETGDLRAAEDHLQRAVQINPANANQYYFLGIAQMKQQHLDDAEQSFRRGLAIFSSAPGFHLNLGLLREAKGDLAGAGREYRAELAIGPSPAAQQRLAEVTERLRQNTAPR